MDLVIGSHNLANEMRISPILVHEFISLDILSTCPHLPASAFSSSQVPRSHLGIWGWAVDCAPANLHQKWFICIKNVSFRWSLSLCTSGGILEWAVSPLGPGWPCAPSCSPQCAENKILAWGFPLLLCICSWSPGWMSVPAICCGLSFSAGRHKGKWWMLLPWSGLQEKWDKKRETSNSSCILESHRLMSCQNVTASTHTSKRKVKSCQNLTFSQTLWVSSVASTNTPVGAQQECTSKTLGLVKLDWSGKFNPGQLVFLAYE